MPTSVPSKNDFDKITAQIAALNTTVSNLGSITTSLSKTVSLIDGRVTALEAAPAPGPDPVPTDPPPPTSYVALPGYRRWRGSLYTPPIKKDGAQLKAEKWVLPYNAALMMGEGPFSPLLYDGAGDYQNLDPANDPAGELSGYQGATGERRELQIVPDDVAAWIAGALGPENMLAEAEAQASVPVHVLIDGRIPDVYKNNAASFYKLWGAGPFWNDAIADINGPRVYPDSAHYPAFSYVPYLATGDNYYLEELQWSANYHVTSQPPDYRQPGGILWPWQQRQWAWAMRDLISAYIATPDGDVPAPLQPRAYFKRIIEDNIKAALDHVTVGYDGQPLPHAALATEMGFIVCTDFNFLAPWQQDFISMVLGWAVYTGRCEDIVGLRTLYALQVTQAIKRATGPLRSQAIQYNWPNGVADSWSMSLSLNGKTATSDGNYPPDADKFYAAYLRCSLSIAALNNVPGSVEGFTFADAQVKRNNFLPYKLAV